MCWWGASRVSPPSEDDDRGHRHDSDRRSEMEVKTHHYPAHMEPRGGVHSTPLRHVQRPNSSGKLLELTPLWETVLRYDRLPQTIDKSKVFSEMSQRLNDPEWEVRQHALRVLADLVPVVARSGSPEDLDNYMIPLVLTEVTYNLGHPAPAVRRSALDVLSVYLRSTSDAQFVLRSVVTQGLESPAASGALAMSVIVGLPRLIESTLAASPSPLSHQTLVNLVTGVSKKLTQMSYQTYAVSCMIEIRDRIGESRFDHFLESYYPQVKRDFDVLCKVYQIESPSVRDSGIDLQSTIESPPPSNRTDFEVWSDSSNSPTVIHEPVLPRAEIKAIEDVPQANEIRKDFEENPRGEEEEYDDDTSPEEEEYEDERVSESVEELVEVVELAKEDDQTAKGRVVLEREIQFNENTAITMRILEEEENKGKNLEVEEPEESGRKTPRRVRFGGEVVKLRTPDSDITAREENKGANGGGASPREEGGLKEVEEIMQGDDKEKCEPKEEKDMATPCVDEQRATEPESFEVLGRGRPRSSHIPLPVVPALSRPSNAIAVRTRKVSNGGGKTISDSPSRGGGLAKKERGDDEEDIPTMDGGDSLTSSSEGEPARRNLHQSAGQLPAPEALLRGLSFLGPDIIQLLQKKEDWRGRVRGLERISAWLRNGEGGVGVPPRVVPPLLDYLVALVGEERSPRLVTTGLRTLRCLVKTSPSSLLLPALTNGLVSSILRHLGGGSGVSVRLEAVECSKALMRATGPAHVVRVLLSDSCLNAKSSKLRENSLLWLMYALMTFPSGEFDVGSICDAILATGAVEPKRRVRQSVLDTAAVLGQFVSRSRLKVANPSQFEEPAAALFFNEALQARLARRQLPTVSPEGLILYALQVPQASTDIFEPLYEQNTSRNSFSRWDDYFGPDVEWVLAGSGSLSAGSARSRAQLENAQRAFISPTQSSDNVYSMWSGNQDFMAIGMGMPQRNILHDGIIYTNDDRTFYDDNWPASEEQTKHHHTTISPHQQGSSRPLYLRYQTGQNEGAPRAIGGYTADQGFPQLSSSYNGHNQYQQSVQGRRGDGQQSSVVLLNSSWAGGGAPLRSVGRHQAQPPPPHVSFNAGSSHQQPPPLPPIINWRNSSTPSLQQLQVDVGPRLLPHEEHRQGRWSRRQDNDNSRNRLLSINGTKDNGTVHKSILSRHKSERSRSVESFIDGQLIDTNNTATTISSPPTAVPLSPEKEEPPPTQKAETPPPTGDEQPTRPEEVASELGPAEIVEPTAEDTPPATVDEPKSDGEIPQEEESPQNEESVAQEKDKNDVVETSPQPTHETKEKESDLNEEPKNEENTEELEDSLQHEIPLLSSTPIELQSAISEEESPVSIEDKHDDLAENITVEDQDASDITDPEHNHSPPPSNNSDGKSVVSISSEFSSVDSNQPYNTDLELSEKSGGETKRKISRPVGMRMRPKRFVSGAEAKIENGIYSDNLSPFAQPKESLTKTFLQLENPEWEVVMQGLQGLLRLTQHHTKMLQPMSILHTAVVLLTKHVRNLRSQVARAACQAAQKMFVVLGRALDSEVDDLAGGLLSRMADTNKFLRADAMAALDAMVKNVSPIKSISALVNKGSKHQNALVRGATSKLLLVLCNRLGPEKTLSLPRETRDSILLTGAKMLQEGSLDTRRYAKEMFTLLSADPRLHQMMANVIPSGIMRSIGKVLARINTK